MSENSNFSQPKKLILKIGQTTEIIKILDVNGDREVSFSEFVEGIDKVNDYLVKSNEANDPNEVLKRLGQGFAQKLGGAKAKPKSPRASKKGPPPKTPVASSGSTMNFLESLAK